MFFMLSNFTDLNVPLLAALEVAATATARADAAVRFAPEGVGGLAKLRVAVAPAGKEYIVDGEASAGGVQ